MSKITKTVFILLLLICITFSCKEDGNNVVNISNIELSTKINRFDIALFSLNPDSLYNQLPGFAKEYDPFFELFTHHIIAIGGMENKAFPDHLKLFLTDYLNLEVYEETVKLYADISDIEEELNKAFKHFKYYFPEKDIPKIYSYVSRFNQSVITSENVLGIGLDKYLGRKSPYYTSLGLPNYLKYNMYKDRIVTDCMSAVAMAEFEYKPVSNDIISNMLYKAKIQYFIEKMLPEYQDTLIWGFNQKQVEWCLTNEESIWLHLVDQKLLFSTEYMEIKRYTDEGPFTTTFSKESPAKSAVWVGSNILKSYLKNNPGISFFDVMNENDYHKILNNSKYEP